MNIREVTVPDIGDFKDVPVIEILVKPGDVVNAEDTLVTLESDKATLEVPAPFSGIVTEILVAIDSKVSEGTPILKLQAAEATSAPAPLPEQIDTASIPDTPQASVPVAIPEAEITQPAIATLGAFLSAHASPSVRAFARELSVDVNIVTGTGPKERILRDDVLSYVKTRLQSGGGSGTSSALALDLPPWPQVDFTKFGDISRVPLSRLRKISGPNLARNWVTIPHVTNFDEADVTALEEFRRAINEEKAKDGIKITMLAFLIKAAVSTLQKFPEFNSSLTGDDLILKNYYHIGFAADTPNGLVVPVIREADKKGIIQIATEMAALAEQARNGKLKPADMQGGCFSISSLGGIGGTGFTPIINAPEVAILGAVKAEIKPVWNGAEFCPRLILPLSLSWDHRVVDGASAGRFLRHLTASLGDFRRILL